MDKNYYFGKLDNCLPGAIDIAMCFKFIVCKVGLRNGREKAAY